MPLEPKADMQHRFVILGAGGPHAGEAHPALRAASGSARVIDWVLQAIAFADPQVHFVSGYESSQVRARYPQFSYWANHEWSSTRAVWSLLKVPVGADAPESWVVAYSDIVFREASVRRLLDLQADVVVGVDSLWHARFAGRSQADLRRCEKVCLADETVTRLGADIPVEQASAEFIGLIRLGPQAVERLRTLQRDPAESLRQASLSDLVELFRAGGLRVAAVDLRGDWAELNDPHDLARFVLGTKAQTLQRLRGVLQCGRIEEQESFTVEQWRDEGETIWRKVSERFGGQKIIVRSSALSEDGFNGSSAGVHASVLDVEPGDVGDVRRAVETVIASYGEASGQDELLIQPMLTGVELSGVAFTRALATGAPYYVINYDDVSGSTDSVTSGSDKHKTVFVRRDSSAQLAGVPSKLRGLMAALGEIEGLLNYDALDVEFAVTSEHGLHILQVRPLASISGTQQEDAKVLSAVDDAERFFVELQPPAAPLVGERAVFGVMPDWNPAEMIGIRPGRLALSLYRDLIGNEVWATQRAEFGYRDVRSVPLIVDFAGQPYVDVRASLNSFVPAELDDALAARLVDFCTERLSNNPAMHDKIEFEIIPTCLALDFDVWETRLVQEGNFSQADVAALRAGLGRVTVQGMLRAGDDLATIGLLERRFEVLSARNLPRLAKVVAMLHEARRFGTLPFAHLARNAFVAVSLLRSAVESGIIEAEARDEFLRSLHTVGHGLTSDARACATGVLGWEQFVARYGHLRPGTYDITSPCYGDDPERFLRPIVTKAGSDPEEPYSQQVLWPAARRRLAAAMAELGLPGDEEVAESFFRHAIEGREYAKFAFTRHLSAALNLLVQWGDEVGLTREELAALDINDIRRFRISSTSSIAQLRSAVSEARRLRALSEAIELPPLLRSAEDFRVFTYPAALPNFVGTNAISGAPVMVAHEAMDALKGRIVLVPQADPGFDWLFGRGIGGLITMYGGANSHMAIRAAEFGLPAAIGVGEVVYRKLVVAQQVLLDPANRIVQVVR